MTKIGSNMVKAFRGYLESIKISCPDGEKPVDALDDLASELVAEFDREQAKEQANTESSNQIKEINDDLSDQIDDDDDYDSCTSENDADNLQLSDDDEQPCPIVRRNKIKIFLIFYIYLIVGFIFLRKGVHTLLCS